MRQNANTHAATKNPVKAFDRWLLDEGSKEFGRHSLYWYVRNAFRCQINHWRSRGLAGLRVNPPIVVAFASRSGSTWVSEMVSRIQNVVVISDPLLERNAIVASKLYGFPISRYYSGHDELSALGPFIDDVVTLQRRDAIGEVPKNVDFNKPLQPFVKIANASWALSYFLRYRGRLLYLCRHPIAVIRSQQRHWSIAESADELIAALRASSIVPSTTLDVCESLVRGGEPMQRRAVEWALNVMPFALGVVHAQRIDYETIRSGDLSDFRFLGEISSSWEADMRGGFHSPSRTTQAVNTLRPDENSTDGFDVGNCRSVIYQVFDAFGASAFLETFDW